MRWQAVLAFRAMFTRSKRSHPSERLPLGAEAALWSIVEVIPDPRNHLALTRDPTAEVRLSAAQIEAVAAAPVPAATASSFPPSPVAPTIRRRPAAVLAPPPPAETAPTRAELPPPPPDPLPPPPVPATTSPSLPSSVMARMRSALLDWAADSPRVTDATAPVGPTYADGDPYLPGLAITGSGVRDGSSLAPLEAALDRAVADEIADDPLSDEEIDLSEPMRLIVIDDEPEPQPVTVITPQIDEGVRELFRSQT